MKIVQLEPDAVDYLQELLKAAHLEQSRNFFRLTYSEESGYELFDIEAEEVQDTDYLDPVTSNIVFVIPEANYTALKGVKVSLKRTPTETVIQFSK